MPARAMVGAGTGSLGRELGNILSTVLDTLGDHLAKEIGSELKSTEDMLANFNNLNTREDLKDLVAWSCDAKALYGSLQARRSAAIVAKQMRRTNLQYTGIHWDEAVLYLALTLSRQQVEELGLEDLVPR